MIAGRLSVTRGLSLSRTSILLAGAIAQCVLTALFVWRVLPSIAGDLEGRSQMALKDAGINWAQTDVDGRDVAVLGLAPSDTQRKRALTAVAGVYGVRQVADRTTSMASRPAPERAVAPPDLDESQVVEALRDGVDLERFGLQYVFRVERDGPGVALRGMVPDEQARQTLLAATAEKFPDTTPADELLINTAAPDGFLRAARQAISVAGLVSTGAVGLRDQVLFVEGLTVSDRDLDRLRNTLEQSLPDGYDLALQVGSRQTLSAMMRENPELADRVGRLPAATQGAPLVTVTPLDRSPEARQRCQDGVNEALAAEPVLFTTGSSDISQRSAALMQRLVQLIKTCPGARVEIGGHTDDQGRESDNLALSQARAESVMEYFVRNGVKLGRLSAVGYGESRPLVENRTAEDRARNRRIELRLTDGA